MADGGAGAISEYSVAERGTVKEMKDTRGQIKARKILDKRRQDDARDVLPAKPWNKNSAAIRR